MGKLSWILLERKAQLDDLVKNSFSTPCLIFKHSTKCFISDVALSRLEEQWSYTENEVLPYFVDAIKHRTISKYICETFEENHETPQILLIDKGECTLEATDMDIKAAEIAEVI